MKTNCWEFKKCGRESYGPNSLELGVCPAYDEQRLDGVHGGINSGRCCWVVAGTMCGGKVQGTFAQKEKNCLSCDFYDSVMKEEHDNFLLMSQLLEKLNKSIIL
jgi:hypothetical protein